ncbi:MAG: ABC transporter ATP-binding protein [Rikenellaceae bacterium]
MLDVKKLEYSYTRSSSLFRELTMSLKSNRIYGLLGKNGAGKTTLLRLMCGLLTPCSGRIMLYGESVSKREVPTLQRIFFLPEEFSLPPLSPMRYAEFYGKFYPKFNKQQFGELLAQFNVELNIKMNKMSFGQKKKAMISFALACNTDLLVLDEPTNGLDIPSKSSFRSIVSAHANEQRSIIISTHQVRDLDQLIDSVVILDESEILLNESLDNVAQKLQFRSVERDEEVLYRELSPRGTVGVVANTPDNQEETPVDLELLFNATVAEGNIISQLFNN